ncbi:MAG: hypothetical protein R6V25_12750 [Desulfatiglandales bacterium]
MVFFANLGVNLRGCLCGVLQYASAQPLDLLDLDKKSSFLNWKLAGAQKAFLDGHYLVSIQKWSFLPISASICEVACGELHPDIGGPVKGPVMGAFHKGDPIIPIDKDYRGGTRAVRWALYKNRGQHTLPFKPHAGIGKFRVRGSGSVRQDCKQAFHRWALRGRKDRTQHGLTSHHLGPRGVQQPVAEPMDSGIQPSDLAGTVGRPVHFREIPRKEVEPVVFIPLSQHRTEVILRAFGTQEKAVD